MAEVTKPQLFDFLTNGGPDYTSYEEFLEQVEGASLDRTAFEALTVCDLKNIIADVEMSEHHLGGDNLVSLVDEVLAAQREGYAIATWYGPNTEALVVGFRPQHLTVVES